MARITVEDCVKNIPNRFDLCLVASNRAKTILSGSATSLDRKEKPAVIALREIADNLVDIDLIKGNIVRSIKNSSLVDVNAGDTIEDTETEDNANVLSDSVFIDQDVNVDD